MTEYQRLFLVQARSDFRVYELLAKRVEAGEVAPCHALHSLQMATELLGKADLWKRGPPRLSHQAFVAFLRNLANNRDAQRRCGYVGRNEQWEQMLRKSLVLAERVEELAPALAQDGPNPEYPWPTDAPEHTPAEYHFDIWRDLQGPHGRKFMALLRWLFENAHLYM